VKKTRVVLYVGKKQQHDKIDVPPFFRFVRSLDLSPRLFGSIMGLDLP